MSKVGVRTWQLAGQASADFLNVQSYARHCSQRRARLLIGPLTGLSHSMSMLANRRTTSQCLRLPWSTYSTPHTGYPTYPRSYLTSSSVQGPTDIPLADETLFNYFNNHILAKHSSRPALICRKELAGAHGGPSSRNLNSAGVAHLVWDFEQFNHHIQAVARGLVALGVKKGDRVGVIMGNNRFEASNNLCICPTPI